jgi:anaerobic selenocysteine-containing dehydrogenase
MPNVTTHIRTTCPRDCYDTCGIVVVKQDEKITQVRGDPTHPINRGKLCTKCSIAYNREWLDPNVRLTHPLRRIGPKEAGQFEPISWETALTTIAERFKQIVATSGAQTILNAHYWHDFFARVSVPLALFLPLGRD